MNEVYLSGAIDSVSALRITEKGNAYLMLQMRVSHRNRENKVKHELYNVNAWNNLAAWASHALKPGLSVMVRGYLTQRPTDTGPHAEVTARYFMINQPSPSVTEAQTPPES